MYAKIDFRKYDFYLFIQLSLYLIAIAISAGGGNQPNTVSNNFYYLKAFILFTPIIILSLKLFYRPYILLKQLKQLVLINQYLIFYFTISLISILFSINKIYSLARISYTILELISCSCLLIQYSLTYSKIKDHFITISIIISITLLYLSIFITDDLRYYLSDHFSIHPNIIASFCSHLLILSIIQWLDRKNTFSAIPVCLLFIIQILLFSRSAVLGLAIIGLLTPIMGLYKNHKLFVTIYSLTLLFITTSLLLLFYINPTNLEWILGLITRNDTIDSLFTLTNRTTLWSQLLYNIDIKTFLFGMGYSIIDPNYGIDFGSGILYGAHNMYLSILLGSGVFALIALITYLIKNFITISKLSPSKDKTIYPILLSTIYLLINGMTSEEIGINISLSFSYLYLMTNSIFFNLKSDSQ